MLICRVRPYYLYQCDLITGIFHFRTSVAKGIESSRACADIHPATPSRIVIDAPGGGGKVPMNPGYVLYHDTEKVVIRNYEGKVFEYPEAGVPVRNHHATELCSG